MNAENPRMVVATSAEAAISYVGSRQFEKLAVAALNLCGAEVAVHLRADDTPGLFVPLEIEADGKERIGAVLALTDRAILAWTIGTLRIKNFEAIVPYGSIEHIDLSTRPYSRLSGSRDVLRVDAAQSWTLVFYADMDDGQRIAPIVQGMLDGSMKPVFKTTG
jgi:hypothetical protein